MQGRRLRMGTAGTFPAVLVGNQYVVKFFGPLFNGHASIRIEHAVYRMLAADTAIPTPKMIANGILAPDDDWKWEYLISSQLPGESYGTFQGWLTNSNRKDIAAFVADAASRIHRLIPGPEANMPLDWSRWNTFLTRQTHSCTERHREWGSLPGTLIDQIVPYLSPRSEPHADVGPPVVMHCDLTADHILGEWRADAWIPTGIIDFGDAKVGDRLYELVALHIESFGGDKELLRVFLDHYGLDVARRSDFARRAMSMTLLHEFNVLETVCSFMPEVREMTSLDQLAAALWDVNA